MSVARLFYEVGKKRSFQDLSVSDTCYDNPFSDMETLNMECKMWIEVDQYEQNTCQQEKHRLRENNLLTI